MSMFENKTKPELEAGNFIAYSDEPNTVVSGSGGGGGGGAVFLEAEFVDKSSPLVPKFSFNDVKNALDAGQVVFVKIIAGEEPQTDINYALVYHLAINETPGDEAYAVNANAGTGIFLFSASNPTVAMTDATA